MQQASSQPEQLCTAVRKVLAEAPYAPLQDIQCGWQHGAVVLSGRVASYFLKQLAQDAAMKVDGVETVVNRIEVDQPPGQTPEPPGRERARGRS